MIQRMHVWAPSGGGLGAQVVAVDAAAVAVNAAEPSLEEHGGGFGQVTPPRRRGRPRKNIASGEKRRRLPSP